MVAAVAANSLIIRLPRPARMALLTLHVTMSVGWLGLDGALVALETSGRSTADPPAQAGIASAMSAIALWVLIPVVFLSVGSGLALALLTPWGLLRHWWVLAKCAITIVLAAAGLLVLVPRLHQLVTGSDEVIQPPSLTGRSCALILLLLATGVSVVKPWGRTPRGRRLQRASQGTRKRAVRTIRTLNVPPSD
jgi:hypothetical protein